MKIYGEKVHFAVIDSDVPRSPEQQKVVTEYHKGYIPHVPLLVAGGQALYNQSGEVDSRHVEGIFRKSLGEWIRFFYACLGFRGVRKCVVRPPWDHQFSPTGWRGGVPSSSAAAKRNYACPARNLARPCESYRYLRGRPG